MTPKSMACRAVPTSQGPSSAWKCSIRLAMGSTFGMGPRIGMVSVGGRRERSMGEEGVSNDLRQVHDESSNAGSDDGIVFGSMYRVKQRGTHMLRLKRDFLNTSRGRKRAPTRAIYGHLPTGSRARVTRTRGSGLRATVHGRCERRDQRERERALEATESTPMSV